MVDSNRGEGRLDSLDQDRSAFVARYVVETFQDETKRRRVLQCLGGVRDGGQPVEPAPFIEEEEMVVVMIDLCKYSAITSALVDLLGKASSEAVSELVGEYMEEICNVVMAYGGDIVKFLGDAILVTFNPNPAETLASTALRTVTCLADLLVHHGLRKVDLQRWRLLAKKDAVTTAAPLPVHVQFPLAGSDDGGLAEYASADDGGGTTRRRENSSVKVGAGAVDVDGLGPRRSRAASSVAVGSGAVADDGILSTRSRAASSVGAEDATGLGFSRTREASRGAPEDQVLGAALNAKSFGALPRERVSSMVGSTQEKEWATAKSIVVDNTPDMMGVHVAATVGKVHRVVVGLLGSRLDYFVHGPCLKELGPLLDKASAGEFAFSDAFNELLLKSSINVNITTADNILSRNALKLLTPKNAVTDLYAKSLPRPHHLPRIGELQAYTDQFLNKSLLYRLKSAHQDPSAGRADLKKGLSKFEKEYRLINVLFVKLKEQKGGEGAQNMNTMQRWVLKGKSAPVPVWGVSSQKRKEDPSLQHVKASRPMAPLRNEEWSRLKDGVDDWLAGRKERFVAFVEGVSGMGKSSLLERMRTGFPAKFEDVWWVRLSSFTLSDNRNFINVFLDILDSLVRGNNDRQASPYSVLKAVLTRLFDMVLAKLDPVEKNPATRVLRKQSSDSLRGSHRSIALQEQGLIESVLGFCREPASYSSLIREMIFFAGSAADSGAYQAEEKKTILKALVTRTVNFILEKFNVMIMLDDVQWIDPASSEIIASVISDSKKATQYELRNVNPRYLQAIVTKTAGNFLQIDLLASFITSGGLDVTDTSDKAVGAFERLLSDTIEHVVLAQLDRLDPSFQSILKVSSILGQYFTLDEISFLLEGRSVESLAEEIRLKDAFEFLKRDEDGDTSFYFRHITIKTTIYESLPLSERQRLHKKMAERLEKSFGVQERKDLALMAAMCHHYWESADFDKMVHCNADLGIRLAESGLGFEAKETLTKVVDFIDAFNMGKSEAKSFFTKEQEAKVLSRLVFVSRSLSGPEITIKYAKRALDLCGIRWPKNPAEARRLIFKALMRTMSLWAQTSGGAQDAKDRKTQMLARKARTLKQTSTPSLDRADFNLYSAFTLGLLCDPQGALEAAQENESFWRLGDPLGRDRFMTQIFLFLPRIFFGIFGETSAYMTNAVLEKHGSADPLYGLFMLEVLKVESFYLGRMAPLKVYTQMASQIAEKLPKKTQFTFAHMDGLGQLMQSVVANNGNLEELFKNLVYRMQIIGIERTKADDQVFQGHV
ncbi:hypothetical protein HDU96_010156 [Phlyctochytrium bullatum]|nr:hypothetical protein HDU96_010156 [Phlyctochytrium bullatum]